MWQKPFPNRACLPDYHHLPYNETPQKGREPDDWQPRVQLKKEHGAGTVVLSDAESIAALWDRFIVMAALVVDYLYHHNVIEFKKKKRAEERIKDRCAERRKRRATPMATIGQIRVKMEEKWKSCECQSRTNTLRGTNSIDQHVIRHWHLQKHAAERTDRQRARDAVHNVHVALQDQEDEDDDHDHDYEDDDYNSFDSEDENDNDVLESEGNGDSNNSILPVTGDRDVTKPHSYNTLMKSDKQKISNCSDPENVFYVKISFS